MAAVAAGAHADAAGASTSAASTEAPATNSLSWFIDDPPAGRFLESPGPPSLPPASTLTPAASLPSTRASYPARQDVADARRDDRAEPVVLQAPRGVLARGPAAEVPPGGQDGVSRELPARLLGPVVEQELPVAGPLDALEELLGHDLVGVDVVPVQD